MSKMTMLMTEKEAAAQLRISPRALANLRKEQRISCLRMNRSVRYRQAHLTDFIERSEVRALENPVPRYVHHGAGVHSTKNHYALVGIV